MNEKTKTFRNLILRRSSDRQAAVPEPSDLDAGCVIQMKQLRKQYGEVTAVRGLDLVVRRGEVLGFLGPNGSGKTTTILMILGLTEPSGGWVRVLGYDPLRDPLSVKRSVGYMPDSTLPADGTVLGQCSPRCSSRPLRARKSERTLAG